MNHAFRHASAHDACSLVHEVLSDGPYGLVSILLNANLWEADTSMLVVSDDTCSKNHPINGYDDHLCSLLAKCQVYWLSNFLYKCDWSVIPNLHKI